MQLGCGLPKGYPQGGEVVVLGSWFERKFGDWLEEVFEEKLEEVFEEELEEVFEEALEEVFVRFEHCQEEYRYNLDQTYHQVSCS